MDILQARNISKAFTGHQALDNVSITVPQGSVYGLLGPNGAGKTTMIRIINHITAPDSGEVIFDGHRLTQDDVAQIGYLPEERGLYKKMKVGDQAIFFARLKGLSKRDAYRELMVWFDRFGIADWWGKKVEDLSKGMAQKVQFIITVLHRPKLLIFDEPFSGFDPINANLLKNEILRLRDEGSTIIFSSHNMASVEEICDHITLINKGHDILSGRVDDIRAEYGAGRYSIDFAGDPCRLMDALAPLAGEFAVRDDEREVKTLDLRLAQGASLHDLIAVANDATDLRGFIPSRSSLNDIFIHSVQQSEAKSSPAKI